MGWRGGGAGVGGQSADLEEKVDDGEDDVLGDQLRAAQDALTAQRGACTGVRGRLVRLGRVLRVRAGRVQTVPRGAVLGAPGARRGGGRVWQGAVRAWRDTGRCGGAGQARIGEWARRAPTGSEHMCQAACGWEACGGGGGVGWGAARGGARSGRGGPRESKSHSSSSIHSAHSAAHHTHSQTRLCRSPAGSSQCGRPSWYIRTAKASRRSSRSSGAAPPFGICHVAKGLGVVCGCAWAGGHYGCCGCCGACSRMARRSPNGRPRLSSPKPLRPRPPPPSPGMAS